MALDPKARERIQRAWPDILDRLAAGELVKDVLGAHQITRHERYTYLASEPNARREWDEAREVSADAFYDEALAAARGMANSSSETDATRALDANERRVLIDTLKWAARIRNPRLYGDKAQLDVNVRTVDLTRIISEAQARLEASRIAGRVIEHEGTRVLESARGEGVPAYPQENGAEP